MGAVAGPTGSQGIQGGARCNRSSRPQRACKGIPGQQARLDPTGVTGQQDVAAGPAESNRCPTGPGRSDRSNRSSRMAGGGPTGPAGATGVTRRRLEQRERLEFRSAKLQGPTGATGLTGLQGVQGPMVQQVNG